MRLNAIDTDELKIISTVLKDGLIEVSDVKYLPSIRSFVAMITRFTVSYTHLTLPTTVDV